MRFFEAFVLVLALIFMSPWIGGGKVNVLAAQTPVYSYYENLAYEGQIGFYGNAFAKNWALKYDIINLYNPDGTIEVRHYYYNLRKTDFTVLQLRSCPADIERVKESIRQLEANKSRYYLVMQFIECDNKRLKLDKAALAQKLHLFEKRFNSVLNTVDKNLIIAASIGEEIGPSASASAKELYTALKAKHPTVNFYGWYSAVSIQRPPLLLGSQNRPSNAYADLTDGWFVEAYPREHSEFFDIMNSYKVDRSGDQLATVIWASPNWPTDLGNGPLRGQKTSNVWWNERGWKIFYDQIALSVKHDSDIILFPYLTVKENSNNTIKPLYSEEIPACAQRFFADLVGRTIPHIKYNGHTLVYIQNGGKVTVRRPAIKPHWIPSFSC